MIFHDPHLNSITFHDFPRLENEILKFNDFPGFLRPLGTLYHTIKPQPLQTEPNQDHIFTDPFGSILDSSRIAPHT